MLPNPGMDFTAFDVLPAASLDDLVENIEALADGSAFDSSTDTSTLGGAWTAFTPSWTNLTVGTGATNLGWYKLIGKTVKVRTHLVLGTGFSITGQPLLAMPFTSVSSGYVATETQIGLATITRTGTQNYVGITKWYSTTQAFPVSLNATGNYLFHDIISSAVPFPFVAGDKISTKFEYERA